MVQLSATRCSCIAILWVIVVSFAAITLCVAFQRTVPKVSVYFVIDLVRKLLDTPSYTRNVKPNLNTRPSSDVVWSLIRFHFRDAASCSICITCWLPPWLRGITARVCVCECIVLSVLPRESGVLICKENTISVNYGCVLGLRYAVRWCKHLANKSHKFQHMSSSVNSEW
jgi:hypothetical protein